MNRTAAALALALLAGCSARAPRAAAESPLPTAVAARLGEVRCLLVAPLENASDEPLVGEAATGALAAALHRDRIGVFPVGELRALFEGTPLELPEGVPGPVATELGALLGADAVLYGRVAGRAAGPAPEVTLTLTLAAAGGGETLFLRSVRVVPGRAEPFVWASRRAALEAASAMLGQLGTPGARTCFHAARLDRVRALARTHPAEPGPPSATRPPGASEASPEETRGRGTTPAPAPTPTARRPSLSPRQEAWAARLAARERFVVQDVSFAGRAPLLENEAGLSDLSLALAATPRARVRLEGFVDAGASAQEDLRVSMELARTAGRRLVELGVARDRVTWAGRGREDPVAPGFTARGRRANRRVEVVVLPDAGVR